MFEIEKDLKKIFYY